MNQTRKGIFAPSRLGLALLAVATLSCSSLEAQTTTLISDSFDSSPAGPLNGRVPGTTVGGAAWVAGTNFTLPGNNSASATIVAANQTAAIDLGSTTYFSTPGTYTLTVDVDYPAPTSNSQGGNVVLAFMSEPAMYSAASQSLMVRDHTLANQASTACAEYANGGGSQAYLPGTVIGGSDSPFTLTVIMIVTDSGFWQMNSYLTNRNTGQIIYPRGSIGPIRMSTSPAPIRYVGLNIGGAKANSPVIDNFKLTYAPIVQPAFYYLDTDQTSTQSWDTTSHWNTSPSGTGTDATALARIHDYFTNNRILRSPAGPSPVTFPGGSLTIDGGGLELRQSNAAAEVTVKNITSRGGFISNAAGAWVTRLNADNIAVTKTGIETVLTPNGTGRTLYLSVGRLAGAGTLDIHGGGTFQLAVTNATNFTGKITKAAGTGLQLQGSITSKASVVISTPAEVNLNGYTWTVGALTVGGSVKSPGTHPASTLGFSGAGEVIVETPRPEAETLFGVNLAGAEGGSLPGAIEFNYKYPTEAELDYYKARGLKLIRLPFRWERIQRSFPNGALDPTELTAMDNVLNKAADRGLKVILDMHNYSSRWVGSAWFSIGSTTVQNAHYADGWRKIAARYANHPAIYGYDVMNEPAGTLWEPATAAAVAAIREVDTTHFIIVENNNHAGAQVWSPASTLDSINDGATNRMIYSAHSYWDIDLSLESYDGIYKYKYDQQAAHPDLGAEKAKRFVDWCNSRNVRGFIGEYGVPNNPAGANPDIRWNNVLFRFLQYLEFNGISGTYWAGGPFWPTNHGTCCEPKYLTDPDRPVMPVLRAFGLPLVYEVESIATVTATNTVSTSTEPQLNAGVGESLAATAAGNSVSYTLTNVPKGKYQVFVRTKKYSARGKYELFLDGSATRQGTEQDQYVNGTVYAEQDLGEVTFSTTGNRVFKFQVSGKNASSTAYTLAFDCIRLQPLGL